jgi:uncharacterized protein YndB with AHSA1/START domain
VLDETSAGAQQLVSVTAERAFRVAPRPLWTLWTTKEGLSSWWAPEGFVMEITALDVRPGGAIDFRYEDAATARDPRWKEELRSKGQSTSWEARGTFLAVDPVRLLAFRQFLDFGPKAKSQEYRMSATFREEGSTVHVLLKAEAPGSKHWAFLGRANLEAQLERLARLC